MVKTIQGMITVSTMVLYTGMMELEKNDEMNDCNLTENLNRSLNQVVDRTSKADTNMLIIEYGVAKAIALAKDQGRTGHALKNKSVLLYEILHKEVVCEMSQDQFESFKEWTASLKK